MNDAKDINRSTFRDHFYVEMTRMTQHRTADNSSSPTSTTLESIVNCAAEVAVARADNKLRHVPFTTSSQIHGRDQSLNHGCGNERLHHQHQQQYIRTFDGSPTIGIGAAFHDNGEVLDIGTTRLITKTSLSGSAASMMSEWPPRRETTWSPCMHGWQCRQYDYALRRQDTYFRSRSASPAMRDSQADGVHPNHHFMCNRATFSGECRARCYFRCGDNCCYDNDEEGAIVSNSAAAHGNRNSSIATSIYPMIGSCCTSSRQFVDSSAAKSTEHLSQLSSFLPPSSHQKQAPWVHDLIGSIDLPVHVRRDCRCHQRHQQCNGSSASIHRSSIGCVYASSDRMPSPQTVGAHPRHNYNRRPYMVLCSDQAVMTASGSTMTSATVQSAPAVLYSRRRANREEVDMPSGQCLTMKSADPTMAEGWHRPDVFVATEPRCAEDPWHRDHVIGYPYSSERSSCTCDQYGDRRACRYVNSESDTYQQNKHTFIACNELDEQTAIKPVDCVLRYGQPVVTDIQYWV